MTISLINDLKIKDAGVDRNVTIILEKISVNDNDVTVNFCDCGVDYPATSKIIDKILSDLSRREGGKSLTIIFDFDINEFVLHKWFFLGSEFFEISEENKDLTNDDFIRILNQKLKEYNIHLTIEIQSSRTSQKKILRYGN